MPVSKKPRSSARKGHRGSGQASVRPGKTTTIAFVVAHPVDFEFLQQYSTFEHEEYETYLDQLNQLLDESRNKGCTVSLALLDVDDFQLFCGRTGIDADTSVARMRYAEFAVPLASEWTLGIRDFLSLAWAAGIICDAPEVLRRDAEMAKEELIDEVTTSMLAGWPGRGRLVGLGRALCVRLG